MSLASTHKTLQYDTLLREVGIDSVRELEDLIIECIYQVRVPCPSLGSPLAFASLPSLLPPVF